MRVANPVLQDIRDYRRKALTHDAKSCALLLQPFLAHTGNLQVRCLFGQLKNLGHD